MGGFTLFLNSVHERVLCIFHDRALWVLSAFRKTSWFIVKIGLNPSTMKKFWLLKDPLRLNAFFFLKECGNRKIEQSISAGQLGGVF